MGAYKNISQGDFGKFDSNPDFESQTTASFDMKFSLFKSAISQICDIANVRISSNIKEARTIENVAPYISGEFSVRTIKPANICELFLNNRGERFYKCKVNFITLNKKGKEKRTASYMLVEANSTDTAEKRLKEGMEGTMADYDIEAIVETKIMDVYSYEVPAETEENK